MHYFVTGATGYIGGRLIPRLTAIETNRTVIDSLLLARAKHPGQKNNLDALCKRYGVDNSQRDLHGALLDAEILADVYLLMNDNTKARESVQAAITWLGTQAVKDEQLEKALKEKLEFLPI